MKTKRLTALLISVLMILQMFAVSASAAYIEQQDAPADIKFVIPSAETTWVADGVISDGEYGNIDVKPSQLSVAASTDEAAAMAITTPISLHMSYDEDYVYIAATTSAKDYICEIDASNAGNMWAAHAVQLSLADIYATDAGERLETGYALSSLDNNKYSCTWYDPMGIAYDANENGDYIVVKNGNVLVYEMRVPYEAFSARKLVEGDAFLGSIVWAVGPSAQGEYNFTHIQLGYGITGDYGKDPAGHATFFLGYESDIEPEPEPDVPVTSPYDHVFENLSFSEFALYEQGTLEAVQMRAFAVDPNGKYYYGGLLNGGTPTVYQFDASNGVPVSSYQFDSTEAENAYIKAIAADDRGHVYMGVANNANDGAVYFAICTDNGLDEIKWVKIEIEGKVGVNGAAVTKIGDKYYLYFVTNYETDRLYCYDVTDIKNPTLNTAFGTDGTGYYELNAMFGIQDANNIAVDEEGYIYVCANTGVGSKGDTVVKISPAGTVVAKASVSECFGVAILDNGYLAVCTYEGADSKVYILNQQALTTVKVVGFDNANYFSQLGMIGNYLYVANERSDSVLISSEIDFSAPVVPDEPPVELPIYIPQQDDPSDIRFSVGAIDTEWKADGVISDGEYAKMDVKQSQLSAAACTGERTAEVYQMPAVLYMSYDEDYIYIAATTPAENHICDIDGTNEGNMWAAHAIQLSLAAINATESGERLETGYALSTLDGSTYSCNWSDPMGYAYDADDHDDYTVVNNGSEIVYEMRIPYEAFVGEKLTAGDSFRGSLVWAVGNSGKDEYNYAHLQLGYGISGDPGKNPAGHATFTLAYEDGVMYGSSIGSVPYVKPDRIVVDGQYSPVWDNALKVEIDQFAMGDASASTKGTAYMYWTEGKWYLFVDVKDNDVAAPDSYMQANEPWRTDSVEMFFDFGHAHSDLVKQFRIDCSGYPSYYTEGGADYAYGNAAADYFDEYQVLLDEDGYNIEMVIDLEKWNLTPGDEIGIQMQINDVTTAKPVDWRSCWNMHQSMGAGSWDAILYDYVTLEEKSVEEEKPVEIPVTEDEETVSVKVEDAVVQGNAVTVNTVDETALESIFDATATDSVNTVTIDVSNVKSEDSAEAEKVQQVTIPAAVVDTIKTSAEKNNVEDAKLAVHLTSGSIILDKTTLDAINKAAESNANTTTTVSLVIDNTEENLNETQEIALENEAVFGKLEIYMEVAQTNNTTNVTESEKVHYFNGGTVQLEVPFAVPEGMEESGFTVYYLDEDGNLYAMDTQYVDGKLVWTTNHFSDYIILYKEAQKKPVKSDVVDILVNTYDRLVDIWSDVLPNEKDICDGLTDVKDSADIAGEMVVDSVTTATDAIQNTVKNLAGGLNQNFKSLTNSLKNIWH